MEYLHQFSIRNMPYRMIARYLNDPKAQAGRSRIAFSGIDRNRSRYRHCSQLAVDHKLQGHTGYAAAGSEADHLMAISQLIWMLGLSKSCKIGRRRDSNLIQHRNTPGNHVAILQETHTQNAIDTFPNRIDEPIALGHIKFNIRIFFQKSWQFR